MTRPGLEKVLHIVADATQTHPGHPGHLKHLRLDPRRPRCHEEELLALPPAATRKESHPCWQDSVFRRRKGEQNLIVATCPDIILIFKLRYYFKGTILIPFHKTMRSDYCNYCL